MGLFEKRIKVATKDEFDSPVEKVELRAVPTPPPASAPEPEEPPQATEYGIDQAIELMRRLPDGNADLVVKVVKTTLESLKVSVGSIIRDAERKEARIRSRVDVLRKEIGDLEAEIATRKTEIGALEADQRETTNVKEKLSLAERDKAQASGEIKPRPRSSTPPPLPASTFHSIESTLDELWTEDVGKKK